MYLRKPDFAEDLERAKLSSLDESEFYQLLKKHHGEEEIAEALAQNPSCPFRLFSKFYLYMNDAAVLNPNLENYMAQEYWDNVTSGASTRYYGRSANGISESEPEAYRVKFVLLYGEGGYQRYVMSLDAIPEAHIYMAAASKSAALRKVVAARADLAESLYKKLSVDSAKSVRVVVAQNPSISSSVSALLAQDKDIDVLKALVSNSSCSDEARVLANACINKKAAAPLVDVQKQSFHSLVRLAGDSFADSAMLISLAEHNEPCVRFLVGLNANTPVQVLSRIANDGEEWVRAAPAFNPKTPANVLGELAKSTSKDVQVGLASNPSIGLDLAVGFVDFFCDEALCALANTTEYDAVLDKIASGTEESELKSGKTWRYFLCDTLRRSKTGKFLRSNSGDGVRHLFVSNIASKSGKCPEDLLSHYAYYCFDRYSRNPRVALSLLEGQPYVDPEEFADWKVDKWLSDRTAPGYVAKYFVHSDDKRRRVQAVSSRSIQLVDLLLLVLDDDINLRKRLAVRRDLNRFMIEMLARDEKSGVRELIANNVITPAVVVKSMEGDKAATVQVRVSERSTSSSEATCIGSQLLNKGLATERSRLARDTRDKNILQELARDRAASVRVQVVLNHQTPEQVIDSLCCDVDSKVRAAVAYRINDSDLCYKLLGDSDHEVRLSAAKNRHWYSAGNRLICDARFLAFAVDSEDEDIRGIAAEFSADPDVKSGFMNDSEDTQLRLVKNRSLTAQEKIAFVKATSNQKVLEELAWKTESEELFLIVASKITGTYRSYSIENHWDMLALPHIQDSLCTHPLSRIRIAVARQNTLSPFAQATLLQDTDEQVRKLVLQR
ncbi:hypothetical protein [Atopomonas hussainii]|uniref:hypothetical protein n=1 Tax=Atopomonas hussainii TaxID=1429083 RepID=UPI0009000437|nr:hypothetical protein [Atopomonas hussainii]